AMEVVAADRSAGICLVHMQGEPVSMQSAPDYRDAVADVIAFLGARRDVALASGIASDRIVLDPGIGFGKTVEHNLALLARQRELMVLGSSVLVGWSRKSTLGVVTGRPIGERQAASVAAAVLAVERGARIVRVHDVAATVDALKLWRAATQEQGETSA
ncbi:MAG: dihydropteroate synthase, partial [Aquincola sp.]|nr:dihydropteroate synthase [Aquincola sp.]